MDKILKALSVIGLILSLLPALLSFNGVISFEQFKILLLTGTILWFSTAPFWINKKKAT
ncbi:MAG: hypothetical protein WEB30_15810 [Cyclobacteriaceae bacterium]